MGACRRKQLSGCDRLGVHSDALGETACMIRKQLSGCDRRAVHSDALGETACMMSIHTRLLIILGHLVRLLLVGPIHHVEHRLAF